MSLDPSEAWRESLARTAACLDPEQFEAGLSAAQKAHLDGCARCQAEKALWESFALAKASDSEALPVQWIVAETKRRLAPPEPERGWLTRVFAGSLFAKPWLAGAVTACLVAGVGFYATQPKVAEPGETGNGPIVYRSGVVELAGPAGDLPAAPTLLRWRPVAGAASYEVQILEVDREVLWKSESTRDQIGVPAQVRSRLTAGKTVLWQVTAKDAKGNPVASSPSERFRVKPKTAPTGE